MEEEDDDSDVDRDGLGDRKCGGANGEEEINAMKDVEALEEEEGCNGGNMGELGDGIYISFDPHSAILSLKIV